MQRYPRPKTIDGRHIPALPRSPFKCIGDTRKRQEFAYAMYLATDRTHQLLPTAPALRANHAYPSTESIFPDPPAPYAMLEHVLSYLPPIVTSDFVSEQMTLDIFRSASMNISIRHGEYYSDMNAKKCERAIRDTNGMFIPDERRIILREGTYPMILPDREVWWEHVEDILGHELGHFIDWFSGWTSAVDDSFNRVYVRERYMLDTYTASSSSEYFATACWITSRFPVLAERYIPRTCEWFGNFFATKY